MQQENTGSQKKFARNYDAISPSAKSLVLLKGLTNIPYARQTAELVSLPGKYIPDTDSKDAAFWKRVVHFENRYWSIDQLLTELSTSNILELSSGFSFRGLEIVQQTTVNYIDTDLGNIIEEKEILFNELKKSDTAKGNLKMIALNALDENRFNEIVNSFPDGPLVIVNEGLLMYLDNSEKEKLCNVIYQVLKQRGGFWITGDIYVKSTLERFNNEKEDSLKELVEQQRIEDNMFESFESAATFFNNAGFVIDKESATDLSKLSSLKYLINASTEAELAAMQAHSKIQATWRLKVKNDF